ncbi:MarR family transcriptional regulator [Sphingobium sp. Sx8-8]|uniref:MarR family winged helix-turn-helix transcriptional regulator n=1 Tax=Sphingobium sp. Sx8-8 TaxID=2933617 RepID=UPI001F58E373|nr:MarR family transcriptional regulator [Sphingobium sp. Sx8-8]
MSRSLAMIALLDELARTRGRTSAAFQSVRSAEGLAEMEAIVLAAVVRARHAPTVSQIGRSLGHPRQVIQRAADSLQQRDLIRFEDNPEHKRARLLLPTGAGRAMQQDRDRQGLAVADRLTRGIDPQVLADTTAGLRLIRETMERNLREDEEERIDDDGDRGAAAAAAAD